MTVIRICWLLFTLSTAFICAFRGNAFLLALLCTLILPPVITLGCDLAVKNRVKIKVECPVNLEKGKPGDVLISAVNGGRLPLFRVEFTVRIVNRLTGGVKTLRRCTWAPAKGAGQVKTEISSAYCGRLRISVENVRIYDCFGLVGVKCPCVGQGDITVQPDTFYQSVSLTSGTSSSDDSDEYSAEKPGDDLTEPFQIRDYAPGDGIRQIHWKLTGKLDRLIVKDPSLPVTRSVLVLWERSADRLIPENQDIQSEVVVSLGRALLDSQIQFDIAWNDSKTGAVAIRGVRDMDDLVGVIPALMSASPAEQGPSGVETFLQTDGEYRFSHIVYVTEKWTPLTGELNRYGKALVLFCGEGDKAGDDVEVRCFGNESFRSELMNLEI